jgi:mandelamide amidase
VFNTDPGSNAGLPGLSIPAGLGPSGLQVGIDIDGPSGRDERLLALGMTIDKVLRPTPPPR